MYWHWIRSGLALGICFYLATALIKPIGVSTQFVILDGVVASQIDSSLVVRDDSAKNGYSSSNAYLNKSGGKYAKSVANPLNYGLVFVFSMLLGGAIGAFTQAKTQVSSSGEVPAFHLRRFGTSRGARYILAFSGGLIVLWGARLAGGCTSGHMMSGMMQTSVSGYIFAAAAFLAAIPTAKIIYKN